jgi:hypothetical protein
VRDEIAGNIRDSVSDMKDAFHISAQAKAVTGFMAAGVVGLGMAGLISDSKEKATQPQKGFTPINHYSFSDIKPPARVTLPTAYPNALKAKFSKAGHKSADITEDGFTAIEIAANNGISPYYSAALLCIESNCGDPNSYNPSSKAGGLFQFIPSTARQYGLKDRFDTKESSYAFVDLTNDNKTTLTAGLGREPKTGELYLAHQQGAGGALALLANPDKSALSVLTSVYTKQFGSEERAESIAKSAIKGNGGHLKITAGEFANLWITKYEEKERKTAGKVANLIPSQ